MAQFRLTAKFAKDIKVGNLENPAELTPGLNDLGRGEWSVTALLRSVRHRLARSKRQILILNHKQVTTTAMAIFETAKFI